ncbi:MAG: hypothetical protein ACRDRH_10195 [Pseudonocardia sp.]
MNSQNDFADHPALRWSGTLISKFLRFARCGLLVGIFLLSACSIPEDVDPQVSFKPILLPVKFTLSPDGLVITGDGTLVTGFGLISIGAKVELPAKKEESIRVVIRDRNQLGIGLDDIYDVRTGDGSFEVVTNGTTRIQAKSEGEVIIDVTDAQIKSIEFLKVAPASLDEEGAATDSTSSWSMHWQSLPFGYHPWDLTRFAYDDSTIDRWYGAGFALFLVRLALAALLAFIELFLAAVLFVAAFFYMLFGETGRNVFYGLLSLFVLSLCALCGRELLR